MQLIEFLKENNIAILTEWTGEVLGTYPQQGQRLFRSQKDQFANPVGFNATQRLKDFYQKFCDEEDVGEAVAALEQLVKIRAVQDFPPSTAISFLPALKRIVMKARRKAKAEIELDEWLAFETRVDQAALMVFDMYMACRERLYQVRVSELKSGTHILTDGSACPSANLREARRKSAAKQETPEEES